MTRLSAPLPEYGRGALFIFPIERDVRTNTA